MISSCNIKDIVLQAIYRDDGRNRHTSARPMHNPSFSDRIDRILPLAFRQSFAGVPRQISLEQTVYSDALLYNKALQKANKHTRLCALEESCVRKNRPSANTLRSSRDRSSFRIFHKSFRKMPNVFDRYCWEFTSLSFHAPRFKNSIDRASSIFSSISSISTLHVKRVSGLMIGPRSAS